MRIRNFLNNSHFTSANANNMYLMLVFHIFWFLIFTFYNVGVTFAWMNSNSGTPKSTPAPNDNPTMMVARRKIIIVSTVETILAVGGGFGVGCFINPQFSLAAVPLLDMGETVRRSASNLPGYGSSDVFYPKSFQGNWKMSRDVQVNNNSPALLRLTYAVRFINSIEDDAVVADRGFNQAELESALGRARNSNKPTPAPAIPPKITYEWTQSNPNDLRIILPDGTKKEIKVTKRATERPTIDTVSSSEFQRVTQEVVKNGNIPSISARRVVSKWKIVDESTIEGIEIVYEMVGGDPLATPIPGSANNAPKILSKSKLYLVR